MNTLVTLDSMKRYIVQLDRALLLMHQAHIDEKPEAFEALLLVADLISKRIAKNVADLGGK